MARTQIATITGVESVVKDNDMVVHFKFADEATVDLDIKELVPDPEVLRSLGHIPLCLIAHGLRQKGPDAYAGIKDPADARVALEKVWDTLRGADGNPPAWTTKRAKAAPKETKVELLAQAYVAACAAAEPPVEKVYEEVLAKLKKKTPKQRAQIADVAEVAEELRKLKPAAKSLAEIEV